MKKGVIATDLDGTLTSRKRHLEPEIGKFLYDLSSKGWEIIFLTGRFYTYAMELVGECNFPYYLAVQNGSGLFFPQRNECFFSYKLAFEVIPFLENILENLPIVFAVESGKNHDDLYFRRELSERRKFNRDVSELIEKVYFPDAVSRERHFRKVDCISDAYPFLDFSVAKVFGSSLILKELRRSLLESAFSQVVSITTIRHPFHSDVSIMHITPIEGNKKAALEYFLTHLSQNKPFIIAAGDDENDIDFLTSGTFKIVMETAPSSMHNMADYLCPPSKKLGIISGLYEGIKVFENGIN